jgi:hypothetical protein
MWGTFLGSHGTVPNESFLFQVNLGAGVFDINTFRMFYQFLDISGLPGSAIDLWTIAPSGFSRCSPDQDQNSIDAITHRIG